MKYLLCIGALAFGVSASCGAQAQTLPRLRGTIASVSGDNLTIAARDGSKLQLKLAPATRVGIVTKASLADVKPGDFVGATTIPRKNGELVALEIHIFPASARGTGEGSRPWDLAPGSMMTNGDVSGAVQSAGGRQVTLNYKGGEKTVVVTPKTPIVFNADGSRSDVVPGVGIVVAPSGRDADGVYQANRITVGKDGVNPAD
jgi:hypothetical protein